MIMKKIIPVILLCLRLTSCVVLQNLSYNSTDPYKGSSKTDIEVTDFFVGVIEDMYSWKAGDTGDPVIDTAISSFSDNLSKNGYAYGVNFRSAGDNKYLGTFNFTDFQKLIDKLSKDYPHQDLITIREVSGIKELKLNLKLSNYDALCKIVPFLAEEGFKVWGPVYNNPPYDYLTEDDYKELVAFILGEDGPESIDKSSVTIRINLPSDTTIKSTNGKRINTNTVEFSFPLIDFLLLHEPIVFYVRF